MRMGFDGIKGKITSEIAERLGFLKPERNKGQEDETANAEDEWRKIFEEFDRKRAKKEEIISKIKEPARNELGHAISAREQAKNIGMDDGIINVMNGIISIAENELRGFNISYSNGIDLARNLNVLLRVADEVEHEEYGSVIKDFIDSIIRFVEAIDEIKKLGKNKGLKITTHNGFKKGFNEFFRPAIERRERYLRPMRRTFIAATLLIAAIGALGTVQKGLNMWSISTVANACKKLDEDTLRRILRGTVFSPDHGHITSKPGAGDIRILRSSEDLQNVLRPWKDKDKVIEECKKALDRKK